MKTVRNLAFVTALLSALPLLAKVARIPELPPSGFADMEAVTNITMSVGDAEQPHVELFLALNASPSNCVEVSFGVDAKVSASEEPLVAHFFLV